MRRSPTEQQEAIRNFAAFSSVVVMTIFLVLGSAALGFLFYELSQVVWPYTESAPSEPSQNAGDLSSQDDDAPFGYTWPEDRDPRVKAPVGLLGLYERNVDLRMFISFCCSALLTSIVAAREFVGRSKISNALKGQSDD